jgi:hypothetical protein
MERVIEVYQANQLVYVTALGGLLLAYFVYLWKENEHQWWNLIPRRRGRAMRRARRNWVRQDAIDAFVNHVEERVYAGVYTRKEASELYRDARKYWPVKDLFPSPERLKEDIKRRLAAHIHEPVNISNEKEKARPKHMFDKLAKA